VFTFQCSSTSRNCWNKIEIDSALLSYQFQCSSTSRNCWNLGNEFRFVMASGLRFSALQRAEIAEITSVCTASYLSYRFSALQRAEIAEIYSENNFENKQHDVSVLFNEPKLLKSN